MAEDHEQNATPPFKKAKLEELSSNGVPLAPVNGSPGDSERREMDGHVSEAPLSATIHDEASEENFHLNDESEEAGKTVQSSVRTINDENESEDENDDDSEDDDEGNDDEEDDDDDDENDDDNASDISGLSDLSGEDWKPNAGPLVWIQRQAMLGADPRQLLRKMLPSSAVIPDDVDQIELWQLLLQLVSEPPKREKLPHFNTIDDAVNLIREATNIVVLTGAGVSVPCGIPDFRSRDGIYARLAVDFPDLPDPQSMFDITYFRRDPRPFFKFAKEIYPGQFKPSLGHMFIKELENHGKLLRNFTQNIDTIELTAGIRNVVQCHGSFASATCMRCKAAYSCDDIREEIFSQIVPRCRKCAQHDGVRPFSSDNQGKGEGLPNGTATAIQSESVGKKSVEEMNVKETDVINEKSDVANAASLSINEQTSSDQTSSTTPLEAPSSIPDVTSTNAENGPLKLPLNASSSSDPEDSSLRTASLSASNSPSASSSTADSSRAFSSIAAVPPEPIVKPDIVFFGESLPDSFHRQMAKDKNVCDLLIVIGSSLKVRPVALIPSSIPANVPQILINRESLRHLNFDIELLGDCDVVCNELLVRLGSEWTSSCDRKTLLHPVSFDSVLKAGLKDLKEQEGTSNEEPKATSSQASDSSKTNGGSEPPKFVAKEAWKRAVRKIAELMGYRRPPPRPPSPPPTRVPLSKYLNPDQLVFLPPCTHVFYGAEYLYKVKNPSEGQAEDGSTGHESSCDDSALDSSVEKASPGEMTRGGESSSVENVLVSNEGEAETKNVSNVE